MDRSVRAVAALALVVAAMAGCGRADSADSAEEVGDTLAAAMPASNFVDDNAALRRITVEEFTDVSIDIDFSSIGGFDLGDIAPASDISFCDAAASARIAWIDGGAIALQYWHDSYGAAVDVPVAVQSDVSVLLEHVAQRIAWNFRRADEPVVDQPIVEAAHRVVTAAVDDCADLPLVVGFDAARLRAPWAEGSSNDLDPAEACGADLAEVAAAVDRYVELRDVEPRHLEQVEAALLADEFVFFFGSDLHVINGQSDSGAALEPIDIGPCAEY